MTNRPLAPRQARSRESERKLLKAAMDVLAQHGLEGTTIPRIAEHAGLTPGAVYRRFPDKNALLETVILAILENQDEQLRSTLTPVIAQQTPLPALVEQVIASMLTSYRTHAGLLRGLRQFVQGSDHLAFKNKAIRIEKRSFQHLVELFLVYRKDLRHTDPHMAVSFAFVTLTSTLVELILIDHDLKNWRAFIPTDEKSLRRELTRTFLRYLGVEYPKAAGRE